MKKLSLFSVLVISLLFCSCQNKQYRCFDAANISSYKEYGSYDLKDAISILYSHAGVPLPDTSFYYDVDVYKWESVAWHWRRYIKDDYELDFYKNDFIHINNYEDFLSDESECNKGEEPLKEFICRYSHDEKFRESRIRVNGKNIDTIFTKSSEEDFKFFYRPIAEIKSWDSLSYLRARFIEAVKYDIEASYSFSRINEKWYLTDYFDYNDIWNELYGD